MTGLRGTSQPGRAVAGHPPRRQRTDRGGSLSPHTPDPVVALRLTRSEYPHTRTRKTKSKRSSRTQKRLPLIQNQARFHPFSRGPTSESLCLTAYPPGVRLRINALNSSAPGTQGRRFKLLQTTHQRIAHTHSMRARRSTFSAVFKRRMLGTSGNCFDVSEVRWDPYSIRMLDEPVPIRVAADVHNSYHECDESHTARNFCCSWPDTAILVFKVKDRSP